MRVRMLVSVSGTVDGFDLPPKDNEIDLPNNVAADLCDSGHATPVAVKEKVETATAPVADVEERDETAADKPQKRTSRAKTTKESGE